MTVSCDDAINTLIELAEGDISHSFREAAIEALGEIGGPRAREFLVSVINNDNSIYGHALMAKAISALGRAAAKE